MNPLETRAGRALAFNVRLDELMIPKGKGGRGLTLEEATAFMQRSPEDRALLAAMGSMGATPSATPDDPQGELATPAGRRTAFHRRLDEIFAAGQAKTLDEALELMRRTPADAALLEAMQRTADEVAHEQGTPA